MSAAPGEIADVAFLGPEGTFTSYAATRAVPDGTRLPLATIPEVIAAVREGRARQGVVPIENAIEGSVNLTTDALVFGEGGVYLRGELSLPITMALLAQPGTRLDDVTEVRSQPVALGQCQGWLARTLPRVQLVPVASTAEAARQVAGAARGVAALAFPAVAEELGLEVLAGDVADHPGNATRFVVLGREVAEATGADKTSLVVFFGGDRAGLLHQVLGEFALRGVNLVRIESRPTKQGLGAYCIVIDCEGHPRDARVAEALRSVHRHVGELKVLGAYPSAEGRVAEARDSDTAAAYDDAQRWYEGILSAVR
jgi:prephenate dehydratase